MLRFALLTRLLGLFLALGTACHAGTVELSPEELLREGWKQYRVGEFNLAVADFKKLQKTAPSGSDLAVQALFGEATCWNFRRDSRDVDKAIALYQELLQKYPANSLAPWASLDLLRARYLGLVDYFSHSAEISADYGAIYEKYPDTEAGEEAFVFQGNLLAQIMDVEGAGKLLQSTAAFLEKHPQSHYRSALYAVQALCYYRLGQQKPRLQSMIRSLETREFDQKNPSSNFSQQYWEIAYLAEFEVGDFTIARQYYNKLITEYPGNLRNFGAKEALLRMDRVEKTLRGGAVLSAELLKEKTP